MSRGRGHGRRKQTAELPDAGLEELEDLDLSEKPAPPKPGIPPLPVSIKPLGEILETKPKRGKKKAAPMAKPVSPSIDDLPDELEEPPASIVTTPLKKRPGRPRKQIKKISVPKHGILKEPSNAEQARGTDAVYIFEVVYDNPIMFKKILIACNSIDVNDVRMRFDKEEMIIFAENEQTHNKVHARIYGSRINSYYSGAPGLEIGVKLKNLMRVLSTFNNENSKVNITTRQRLQRDKIRISSDNDQSSLYGQYEIAIIPLSEYDWNINEILAEEATYPITFEIPFHSFKKLVSDAKSCEASVVHFEKECDGPMRFSFVFNTNDGRGDIILGDSKMIKLRCNMGELDIFSAGVYCDYIKAFSSSNVSEMVEISADQNRYIIMSCYLDQETTADKKVVAGTERCVLKVIFDLVRG